MQGDWYFKQNLYCLRLKCETKVNLIVQNSLNNYISGMYKKHNRQKVLKTGIKLFRQQGYSNLGVDQICSTTGMTKGAFYNAFKSKENFLMESLSAYAQIMEPFINNLLKKGGRKAVDRLREIFDKTLLSQPKIGYMGCLVNNMMSELGGINRLVGNAASSKYDLFIAAIEPCVIEAQKSGDLNATLDSNVLSELLLSTFYGVLTRAKSLQDYKQGRESMKLLIDTLQIT